MCNIELKILTWKKELDSSYNMKIILHDENAKITNNKTWKFL